MNNRVAKIAIATAAAFAAAAAHAQHVTVFDGQTGRGAGGGGGTGKVSVHDISISKHANAILAFQPSFQGGVFVAAGDLNGDGKAALQRAATNNDPPQVIQHIMLGLQPAAATQGRGVFVLSTDKMTRSRHQNSLKQLGLAVRGATSIQISLLQDAGPGKKKHRITYKLLEPKVAQQGGSFVITFRGANVVPHQNTFYGKGVYKTTDGGQTWIGLLLPAVQKIRG